MPNPSEVDLPVFECKRCDHKWSPRKSEVPLRCGACKSPYWKTPPGAMGGPSMGASEEPLMAKLPTSKEFAKASLEKGRPMIGLMHLFAADAGLVQVRCRKRSCGLWWYESKRPKRPKLCASHGSFAGIPWKEG